MTPSNRPHQIAATPDHKGWCLTCHAVPKDECSASAAAMTNAPADAIARLVAAVDDHKADSSSFAIAVREGVPALLARVRELEDALSALVGACAEDHWPVKAQHMTPLAQARSALAASGTGGEK